MTAPPHFDETTERPPARVPFRVVLASAAGLWLCYFLLTTFRAEMLGFEFVDEMMARRVLASAASVLVTLGLWLILRPFDTRPLWAKIAAALVFAMPAALLSAQINTMLFADMQAKLDEEILQKFARQDGTPAGPDGGDLMSDLSDMQEGTATERLFDLATSRYFMLLAWCALYLALLTGEKARLAERREQDFRSAAKAAELRSLRYQVNPHFLFNTLNSLSALVLTGRTQAAEKMIQTLSTFYRRSLADDPTADVPLKEEIRLQRLYLEIESVRFPSRLRTDFSVPAALEHALVPGMILQPLVENSVKHAVSPSSGTVTIRLEAREEYGRLVLSVADDGAGTARRHHETRPGFGIGLNNVRERVEARFGKQASIVAGRSAEGYVTHLRIPLIRPGDQ